GRHARAEREAAPPSGPYRDRDRRLLRGRRDAPSRTGRRRSEDRHSDRARAEPRRSSTVVAASRRQSTIRHQYDDAEIMAETQSQTAMARETAEIPAAAERLLARTDLFAAIAERVEQAKPRVVVFCGRGSSGHVGIYLRYLFEARLGILASAAAPSIVTAY